MAALKITPQLSRVLEALHAQHPTPLTAKACGAKVADLGALIDGGLVAYANVDGATCYMLTEDGVLAAERLWCLVAQPRRVYKLQSPVWVPPKDVPVRPGAMDHLSAKSLYTKENAK